jgi:hypothetical protein
VVLVDQLAITMNRMTVLEKIRHYDNRLIRIKKRGYKNFQQVFGGKFGFNWFIPSPIKVKLLVENLYY